MEIQKKVALVACDARKREFLFWIRQNAQTLSRHSLHVYGISSDFILEEGGLLVERISPVEIGGQQHLKRLIVDGKLDIVITFWDPMTTDVCDVDIESLIHMAALYNLAIATNRASADFLITSTLLEQTYRPMAKEYSDYVRRLLYYSGNEAFNMEQTGNIVVIT